MLPFEYALRSEENLPLCPWRRKAFQASNPRAPTKASIPKSDNVGIEELSPKLMTPPEAGCASAAKEENSPRPAQAQRRIAVRFIVTPKREWRAMSPQ